MRILNEVPSQTPVLSTTAIELIPKHPVTKKHPGKGVPNLFTVGPTRVQSLHLGYSVANMTKHIKTPTKHRNDALQSGLV